MSTLDQQIRARLDAHVQDPGFLWHADATAAIRAVLDLHVHDVHDNSCHSCFTVQEASSDQCAVFDDCPTIQAIAAVLGIKGADDGHE